MSVFGTGRLTTSRAAVAGAVLVVLITSFLPTSVLAKSTIWSDVAILNSNWSDALNWSNGVPANGDTVYFAAIGGISNLDIEGLSLGKLDMSGYAGSLTQQTIVFGITTDLIVEGTFNVGTLLVGGDVEVGGTLKVQNNITIAGDLLVYGTVDCSTWVGQIVLRGDFPGTNTGTFDMGDGILEVQGNADFSNLASMIWSTSYGELILSGSGSQSVMVSAVSNTFYDIKIDRAYDTDVTTLSSTGATITTYGLFTVNEGVLDLQCDLNALWGTEVFTGGVFRAIGPPLDLQLLGGVYVYGGKLSVLAPGSSIKFSDDTLAPFHVSSGAALEIVSPSNIPILLAQDGTPGGARWGLYADTGASILIVGVVVEDAADTGPSFIRAFNGVDGGNNTGIFFDGSMWVNAGATPFWSDPDNWGGVPITAGNVVAFWNPSGPSIQDIPSFSISALDMTRFAGALLLDQDLTVVNNAGIVAGSVLETGGRALHFGNNLDLWGGLVNNGGIVRVDASTRMHSGYIECHGGLHHFYGIVEIGAAAELAIHGDSEAQFFAPVIVEGIFHALGGNIQVLFPPEPDVCEVSPTGTWLVDGAWPPTINLYSDGVPGGPRWILLHYPGSTVAVSGARIMDGFVDPDVTAYSSVDDGNNVGWLFDATGADDPSPAPVELAVTAAPNPFNPTTTIHYELPRAGRAEIRIYDASGKLVRTLATDERPAGRYDVVWKGRNDAGQPVSSGVYFCRLQSSGGAVVQKLVLLK